MPKQARNGVCGCGGPYMLLKDPGCQENAMRVSGRKDKIPRILSYLKTALYL